MECIAIWIKAGHFTQHKISWMKIQLQDLAGNATKNSIIFWPEDLVIQILVNIQTERIWDMFSEFVTAL